MSELMQKRKPTNVMDVRKTSAARPASLRTRELTQERNCTNAVNVGKLSLSIHSSLYIREFTQVSIPMTRSFHTTDPIQVRNPMGVMIVGKLLG